MVFTQNFEQWQCSGVRAGQCRRALTTKYFRFELGMVGHVTAPAGVGVLYLQKIAGANSGLGVT